MISSIITKFVAKQMAKSKGVIANKKAVEFSSAAMEDRLMRNGFDPNAIKSESELLAVLNSIKQKENKESAERLREKKDIKDPEDMATGGRVGLKGGAFLNFIKKFKVKQSGDDVKEFLSKRQFMKDIVGNTEKAEKARELRMLKEAADEARRNPGFKFENVDIDKDIRPIFDKEIAESLKKNRKLNATGGLAAMLGE